MIKRSFIRAFWGSPDGDERKYGLRRKKVESDINLILQNKYRVPFIAYTFGKENHEHLLSQGIKSKLICDEPYYWNCKETGWHQYGHKLKAIEEAMSDFDEIILLDFDTICTAHLPDNFWDRFYEKMPLQAILRGYIKVKVRWRLIDRRKRPCASFVYLRKNDPIDILDNMTIEKYMMNRWLQEPIRSEEDILAWTTDILGGGWQGADHYWNNFEPYYFYLGFDESYPVYPSEYKNQKTILFQHVNSRKKRRYLKNNE